MVGAFAGALWGPAAGAAVYSGISSAWDASVNGVSLGRAIGAGIVGGLTGYLVASYVNNFLVDVWEWPEYAAGLVGGALGGAAGGAAGAGVGGGDVEIAALSGLAGGFVTAAIPYAGGIIGGGVSSEIAGGDFGEGAMGGLVYNIGSAIGSAMNAENAANVEQALATDLKGDEVIQFSRPVGDPIARLLGARHKGNLEAGGNIYEMGPNDAGNITINPAKTSKETAKYLNNYKHRVRVSGVIKVDRGLYDAARARYYQNVVKTSTRYSAFSRNSNYAANYPIVYGSSSNVPELGFAPGFPSSDKK